MISGITALVFLALVVFNVFLVIQAHNNAQRQKQTKIDQRKQFQTASELYIQSCTQNHPIFAYEHIVQAKLILDEVIAQNGGLVFAEKNLTMPKGKLTALQAKIEQRFAEMRDSVMTKFIERHPELDVDVNEDAGLVKPKRRRRTARTSSSSRR